MTKLRTTGLDTKWTKIARTFSRNFGVSVQLSGHKCDAGDGVIRIPANADDLNESDAQVLEGMLDHEWKHIEQDRKAQERGIETPLDLYRKAGKDSPQLQTLFNLFEDYRIEAELATELIGCADNLRATNRHLVDKIERNAGDLNPFRAIALGILGKLGGFNVNWLPKEVLEAIDKTEPVWSKATSLKDHFGVWDLSEETLKALGEHRDEKKEQEKQEKQEKQDKGQQGQGDKQQQGQNEEEEEADDGGAGAKDGENDKEREQDTSTSAAGGPTKEAGEDNNDPQANAQKGQEKAEGDPSAEQSRKFMDKALDGDTGTDLMDEVRRDIEAKAALEAKVNRRHIPDPETAKQDKYITAVKHSPRKYNDQLKSIKKQISALRSKLINFLKANTLKGAVLDQDSGQIDNPSLYRLLTGDKRIFRQPSAILELDAAITLLIDLSGSMNERRTGGKKIDVARKSAMILAETLNQLGVPTEVLGFNTNVRYGADNRSGDIAEAIANGKLPYNRYATVNHYTYKAFDEQYTKVKTRMADMPTAGTNCDGEAVMWAAQRLAQRKESRKLLVVLSDGQPNLGWAGRKDLLYKDLKDKVIQIMNAGIEIVGVGIMVDHMGNFYPDNVAVNNLEELPKAIFKILKKHLVR